MSNHLYRVVDDESFIKFDGQTGFTAGSQTAFDPWTAHANTFVERHANWGNRSPTPFISTTSSFENAAHLANKRVRRGCSNVQVAIIDRGVVERNSSVYHMSTLIDITHAQIAKFARNEHEYVCVHRIPHEAVIRVCTLLEFEVYCGEQDELLAEIKYRQDLPWPTILGENGTMYHTEDEAYEAKDMNDYLEYLWDHAD